MSRLPIPGSDDDTWGDILNDYLNQSHNSDGTAKDASTTAKGVIQLAGDLGGTAAAPTVPGLASKADVNHTHTDTSPAGIVSQFAGSTAPTGWMLCDGTAVSRTTYASLFAAIGTTYGAGDGSTTFNLPNLRGRVPVGHDATQTEFDALGESGGAKTHTLSVAEMPSHTHVQDAHTHVQNAHNHTQNAHGHGSTGVAGNHAHGYHVGWSEDVGTHDWAFNNGADVSFMRHGSWTTSAAGDHSHTISSATATNQAATATNQNTIATNQNTGGGSAHNNLQPYIVMNYIIKT